MPNNEQSKSCSGAWAEAISSSKSQLWQNEFTPLKYYEFMREEIQREDGITNQRLSWAMSAQGLLVAAMAVLLTTEWPNALTAPLGEIRLLRVVIFREMALGALGFIGLAAAYMTFRGVSASRKSIEKVKEDWHQINNHLRIVPEFAPQAFGHGPHFLFGSRFAVFLPISFVFAWAAYLLAYAFIFWPLLSAHLRCL